MTGTILNVIKIPFISYNDSNGVSNPAHTFLWEYIIHIFFSIPHVVITQWKLGSGHCENIYIMDAGGATKQSFSLQEYLSNMSQHNTA